MRLKRAKAYRKLLHSYKLHFGFREPFQVVVDAEFVQDAARFKMDLVPALTRTLQGEVKPMITQCSMRHLYATKNGPLIDQAKTFERRRCGHHELDEPLSTLECLSSIVDVKQNNTNKHRYMIASQDRAVRVHMRQIPGIPILFLDRSVLILEDMSDATVKACKGQERSKFLEGLKMRKTLSSLGKRKRGTGEDGDAEDKEGDHAQAEETKPMKKKKGPKQPNPLSMKKKTTKPPTAEKPKQGESTSSGKEPEPSAAQEESGNQETGQKKKRKRSRKAGNTPAEGVGVSGRAGEAQQNGSPG